MRGSALTAGLVAALAAAPAAAQLPDANARGFDAVPQEGDPAVVLGVRRRGRTRRSRWKLARGAAPGLECPNPRRPERRPKTGNFIPWRVDGHLLGAWTVLPFLEIGGNLPVTFAQGDNFEAIAGGFPPFNTGVSGGLGDLRLVPRLFTPASWKLPVDVAIVPELRFPTGSAESFLGGNGFIFAPRANLEHAFGAVRLLLNVGLRYRSTGRFINLIVENELTGGGAVVWTLPSGSVFRRPELIAERPSPRPSPSRSRATSDRARLGHHAVGVPRRRAHAVRQALGRHAGGGPRHRERRGLWPRGVPGSRRGALPVRAEPPRPR